MTREETANILDTALDTLGYILTSFKATEATVFAVFAEGELLAITADEASAGEMYSYLQKGHLGEAELRTMPVLKSKRNEEEK